MTSVKVLSRTSTDIKTSSTTTTTKQKQQQYHNNGRTASSRSGSHLVAPVPQRCCRNLGRTPNQTSLSAKEDKARHEIMSIISHAKDTDNSWRNVVGRYSPDNTHTSSKKAPVRSFTPPLRTDNPLVFDDKFVNIPYEEEEDPVGAEIGLLSLSPRRAPSPSPSPEM